MFVIVRWNCGSTFLKWGLPQPMFGFESQFHMLVDLQIFVQTHNFFALDICLFCYVYKIKAFPSHHRVHHFQVNDRIAGKIVYPLHEIVYLPKKLHIGSISDTTMTLKHKHNSNSEAETHFIEIVFLLIPHFQLIKVMIHLVWKKNLSFILLFNIGRILSYTFYAIESASPEECGENPGISRSKESLRWLVKISPRLKFSPCAL